MEPHKYGNIVLDSATTPAPAGVQYHNICISKGTISKSHMSYIKDSHNTYTFNYYVLASGLHYS